jgi:hypothetical protein
MAKGRPSKNSGNPLAKLRAILAGGSNPPLSQPALAQLLNLPYDTLHSVENGRRPLTAPIRFEILSRTGAEWDEATEQWVNAFSLDDTKTPFTYDHYIYVRVALAEPPEAEAFVNYLKQELDTLFKNASGTNWQRLWFHFYRFVQERKEAAAAHDQALQESDKRGSENTFMLQDADEKPGLRGFKAPKNKDRGPRTSKGRPGKKAAPKD